MVCGAWAVMNFTRLYNGCVTTMALKDYNVNWTATWLLRFNQHEESNVWEVFAFEVKLSMEENRQPLFDFCSNDLKENFHQKWWNYHYYNGYHGKLWREVQVFSKGKHCFFEMFCHSHHAEEWNNIKSRRDIFKIKYKRKSLRLWFTSLATLVHAWKICHSKLIFDSKDYLKYFPYFDHRTNLKLHDSMWMCEHKCWKWNGSLWIAYSVSSMKFCRNWLSIAWMAMQNECFTWILYDEIFLMIHSAHPSAIQESSGKAILDD